MSERINVHLPVFSVNSRSIIGDGREDRRVITSHRATQGGHIHQARPSDGSGRDDGAGDDEGPDRGSIGSRSSIRSIGSVGSVQSIGSIGSVLSIGSAGSVLSIGSAGSVLSIGSAGSVLSIGSVGSVGTIGGRGELAGRTVEVAATLLTIAALVSAVVGRDR
jgi:hypothetical protein